MSTSLNHKPVRTSSIIVDFGWTFGDAHGRLPEYYYAIGDQEYPPARTWLGNDVTLPNATVDTTYSTLLELRANFPERGTFVLGEDPEYTAVHYGGLGLTGGVPGFIDCTGGTGTYTTAAPVPLIYDPRDYLDATLMGQTIEFDTQDAHGHGLPVLVTPPGVRILAYEWDFGNGEIGSGPQATTIYTYGQPPASIQCTLTVHDSLGRTFSCAKRLNLQTFALLWGTATKIGGLRTLVPLRLGESTVLGPLTRLED